MDQKSRDRGEFCLCPWALWWVVVGGGGEGFLWWGWGGEASGKHSSDPGQSRAGPFLGALGPVPCPKGRGLLGQGLEQIPADGLLQVESPGWADTVTVTLLQPDSLHLQVVGPRGPLLPTPPPVSGQPPARLRVLLPRSTATHGRSLARTPHAAIQLWQFPAFAKPGHPEDVGGAASGPRVWRLLPGKNPLQPLPLVLWRLPGRVGSVAHAQGAGLRHHPTEAMTISSGGALGLRALPAGPARGEQPHCRATFILYAACCGSPRPPPLLPGAHAFPSPHSCWKNRRAPPLRPSQHLVGWRAVSGRRGWPVSVLGGGDQSTLRSTSSLEARLHDCTSRDRGRTVQPTRDQKQQSLHPSLWPESAPWRLPHGNRP